MNHHPLTLALLAAATGQTLIAVLNFCLPRIMRWQADLEKLPLLVREVFHVHAWFISITLLLFASLTFRFAGELPQLALGRWLCLGIAVFWGIRTIIQVGFYSSAHWRNHRLRLAIHLLLLAVYGGFTIVYGIAGLGGL